MRIMRSEFVSVAAGGYKEVILQDYAIRDSESFKITVGCAAAAFAYKVDIESTSTGAFNTMLTKTMAVGGVVLATGPILGEVTRLVMWNQSVATQIFRYSIEVTMGILTREII